MGSIQKQILSCQQSKYDRTISLKVVIANVACYYQIEIQRENSIDWREGISQIVKCVGVETPHCGNVEMWWIHIVKMWWIHIFSVAVRPTLFIPIAK